MKLWHPGFCSYFGETNNQKDLAETHCIDSCILKCHSPGPAAQRAKPNIKHWISQTTPINFTSTSKRDAKTFPKPCVVLQGIVCTVCTQADDSSISAHDLEQGVMHLPLRWVQLWEAAGPGDTFRNTDRSCSMSPAGAVDVSVHAWRVPGQAEEWRILMQSTLMWMSSSMSRRCWLL